MASLKEELWRTLQDLSSNDFKNFKWFLNQDGMLPGFTAISVAALENAAQVDVVDRMVENYCHTGALQITIKVLKKINRNDLAQSLFRRARDLSPRDADQFKNEFERKKAEQEDRIKQMIKERETKIQEIKRSAERSKASAEDSKKVLSDLLQSLQNSFDKLVKTIEENQKMRQKQAEESTQELERQIRELTKQSGQPNLQPGAQSWTCTSVPPPIYEANTKSAVDELVQRVSSNMDKLLAKVRLRDVQQFAVDVTLDANTASPYLLLSDNAKQIQCGEAPQNLPAHPGRFNPSLNVLGRQGFSAGRFYYQVQVEGKISWDVGVVKESITRTGSITASPQNGFWNVCLRKGGEYRSSSGKLSLSQPPQTVGVFVDYDKGLVSFYDVASADLIHCFTNCSFSGKLYPFFSPGGRYGGTNSAPLIISTVCDTGKPRDRKDVRDTC